MNAKNSDDVGDRYFYVFLTEERKVGDESKHTPQHITLIPPFEADRKDVLDIAAGTALEYNPFIIETGEKEMFGPKKDIPVILIKPSEILTAIHVSLLRKLNDRNLAIHSSEYIGDNFTPHIAIKSFHSVLDEAKPVFFDHVAVMHKYKNIKTIIAKNALDRAK